MSDALPIPKQSTPSSLRCRHIGLGDSRCGSPAMRGESFCYHHHQTRRPVENLRHRRARQSTFSLPQPNSRNDIQQALGTLIVRIASNDIDLRRAGLLLYALQIANSNLNHHQSRITQPKSTSQPAPEQSQPAPEQSESATEQSESATEQSHSSTEHPGVKQICHPERSAAESKDQRLKPQPSPKPQPNPTLHPNLHYGSGIIPDLSHPQTEILNPNHDFTPSPPVCRHISSATGAALLDALGRSEGAEHLPQSTEAQSPEDRHPSPHRSQTVISTGAGDSSIAPCAAEESAPLPMQSATAQTTHEAGPKPDPCELPTLSTMG